MHSDAKFFSLAHVVGLLAITVAIVSLTMTLRQKAPPPYVADPIINIAGDGETMCLQHAASGWTCHKVIK